MPKPRVTLADIPYSEQQRREVRERVFRELRANLDLYWQMAGSLAARDHFDHELSVRMAAVRLLVLQLIDFVMPVPRCDPVMLDAPDESRSLH